MKGGKIMKDKIVEIIDLSENVKDLYEEDNFFKTQIDALLEVSSDDTELAMFIVNLLYSSHIMISNLLSAIDIFGSDELKGEVVKLFDNSEDLLTDEEQNNTPTTSN